MAHAPPLGLFVALLMLIACVMAGRALYLLLRYYDRACPADRDHLIDKVCTALVMAMLLPGLSFVMLIIAACNTP